MKKIIIFTALILFIPFVIVNFFNVDKKEEIKLRYESNIIIRVKRLSSNEIEYLPLEEYIVGVLAGEMPIYFEKEAFKAQAVAARSYALKRIEYNKNLEYDVVDSVLNQVYLDNDYLKEAWKDNYTSNINKLRQAVNETSLEYLDYNGEVIDALFFSTSNGYTESSSLVFNIDLPYLQSVSSNWDSSTSSVFKSTTKISLNEFYNDLGIDYSDTLDVKILKRSNTNRVLNLSINGKKFTGRNLYDKLGLKSTDFMIEQNGDNVIISTIGYGHGVGMSQYGAEGMALEGYLYTDILNHYYVGTSIKKIEI